MKNIPIFLAVLFGFNCNHSKAQSPDMVEYNGNWEAMIHPSSFSYKFGIEVLDNNEYQIALTNYQKVFDQKITSSSKDEITLRFLEIFNFTGDFNEDKSEIAGFIKIKSSIFHLILSKTDNNKYEGNWNSFYINELNPAAIYLAIENGKGESFEAYPIIPDNRYRGPYADDFEKKDNIISFLDHRSGHSFEGELKGDTILMDIKLGSVKVTSFLFTRSKEEWDMGTKAISKNTDYLNPIAKRDGLNVGSINAITDDLSSLVRMTDSIDSEVLTNVHSVLISHKGSLIYEHYFNGFYSDLPRDTRSAAKSIASAAVGIAINDNILKGVHNSIYSYIPTEYQYTKNERKEKISLHHLLTMSSGLDAIDFGIERQGAATENNYQQSVNWLKTVLEAPMIFEAGANCNYGSANPYLLGVALAEKLEQPVEEYMEENIFGPLEIVNYSEPIDDRGDVYFGGGSYFIPRDLMKFGLLYANAGNWKGQQLLTEEWVEASFKNYKILENTTEKNGYGYLFWHELYNVNGREIRSIEARGAGGQLIAIISELDLVVVINSGNYRNGRYWQPQLMMEEYVLPCFVD